MTFTPKSATQSQAGFTLVELAVVMIIIGLLIGGVLKGQELITNAQITATVAQVKAIDAATTTFRDMYDAMPGDITQPATRLPNCGAAPCSDPGNGNRRVDTDAVNVAPAAAVSENISFWTHLSAADLLSGINPALGATWGGLYPTAEIAGGFYAGFHAGGAALGSNANARQGHYLALHNDAANGPIGGTLQANLAARMDNKLDDGVPNTGTVFDDGGCDTGAGIYDEANQAALCDIFIRFQN